MQQAARVSDYTAFFNADATEEGKRTGYLVEFGPTKQIFNQPKQEATKHYVSGQFRLSHPICLNYLNSDWSACESRYPLSQAYAGA